MKRRNVYDTILIYSKDKLKNKPFRKDLIEKGTVSSREKSKKIIDEDYNSIYKDGLGFKKELLICGPIFLIGLIVPVALELRLLIGISLCVVALFIMNKGARFLIKDISNNIQFKKKIKFKYRPKYGKYEPIIVGFDETEDEHIIVNLLKNNVEGNGLIRPMMYIADKETVGECIQNFATDKPIDLESTSDKIVKVIVDEYNKHTLNYLHDEELKKSKNF